MLKKSSDFKEITEAYNFILSRDDMSKYPFEEVETLLSDLIKKFGKNSIIILPVFNFKKYSKEEINKLLKLFSFCPLIQANYNDKVTNEMLIVDEIKSYILQENTESLKNILNANIYLLNEVDENYETFLHFACEWKKEKSVQTLLELGANPNPVKKNGETPLHLASSAGVVPIVDALIRHGAIINVQDLSGDTPLSNATLYKHKEVVDILKAHITG